MDPFTHLIGMSLSCPTTSGLELRRTLYSRVPSFAEPAGRITFCALIAALTSDGDSPLAYRRDRSMSTLISRGTPPKGGGRTAPGAVASGVRRTLPT